MRVEGRQHMHCQCRPFAAAPPTVTSAVYTANAEDDSDGDDAGGGDGDNGGGALFVRLRAAIASACSKQAMSAPLGFRWLRPVLPIDMNTHVLQTVAQCARPPGRILRAIWIAWTYPSGVMKFCQTASRSQS